METGTTLRTIPFKEVYEGIVSRMGLDPSQAVPHNLWQAIPRNVNKCLGTAWTYWEWPYLDQCDERAFARTWLHDHQFKAGEVIIYVVDLKYYQAVDAPAIGVPPTNTTHWAPVTDPGSFIAFDQICRRPMGMVLGVYKGDPRSNGCGHHGLPYRPQANGIAVCGSSGPTVFVKYQLPVPRFSLTPYAPGRAYKTGNLIYDALTSECYIAVAPSQDVAPPDPNAWLRQDFPEFLEDYVVAAAYASCLKETSQAPGTADQQQMKMMWARDALQEAEDALVGEIDKLKAMGQRFHYRAWKQAARCLSRGMCATEPWIPPESGGLEPPVTTLKQICESDPTAYPPAPETPGTGGGGTEERTGIARLVSGQSYIDVVFEIPQPNANWILADCSIVNTSDESPLNLWAGITTSKTVNGFTVQLSGAPDSGNYYLHYSIREGSADTTAPATTYNLSGPSSGGKDVPSTPFTVQLPADTTVAAPVTVTPDDGGAGGTFTPASVTLTTAMPGATFTYTPAAYGAHTISFTNDGGLSDPGSRAYTAVASTYTLSGPSSGPTGAPSTNFTVALPAGGVVLGTATILPSAGGGAGVFTPATVNLTTAAPSATFTFTPASTGAKTISVTNNKGLTNPGNLTYTATAAVHLLDTLISYWKLDEAAGTTRNDSVGTNHLTDHASVASVAAKINNGALFNTGTLNYLSCANNASLQVSGGEFTFSFWIGFTSVATFMIILGKFDSTANTYDYVFGHDPANGFLFGAGTAGGSNASQVSSPASTGVWYHIVGWIDSSDNKLRLRINDATTYTASVAATLALTTNQFLIGVAGNPIQYGLSANVDEIGFWKRKLSAAEITALYNGGAGLPLSSFTA